MRLNLPNGQWLYPLDADEAPEALAIPADQTESGQIHLVDSAKSRMLMQVLVAWRVVGEFALFLPHVCIRLRHFLPCRIRIVAVPEYKIVAILEWEIPHYAFPSYWHFGDSPRI